jgi:NADPH:quinone reductase-like Zn-dependent oxidoreductase
VLGIECVGTVVSDPSGTLAVGQRVAAMMGGMGRQFDGSYAEYTSVPSSSVFPLETELPWEVLGALPEMMQPCHGSLHAGLEVQAGETLLIRGGTSSIGLTSLAMAKHAGLKVIATSRSEAKADMLQAAGADDVVIDAGPIAERVRTSHPRGVDRVLELIGTTTLLDSLQCARSGGVVCMTGILGGQWELSSFRPMDHIPTAVRLTSYAGGASDISRAQLQPLVLFGGCESSTLEYARHKRLSTDAARLTHAFAHRSALARQRPRRHLRRSLVVRGRHRQVRRRASGRQRMLAGRLHGRRVRLPGRRGRLAQLHGGTGVDRMFMPSSTRHDRVSAREPSGVVQPMSRSVRGLRDALHGGADLRLQLPG